MASKKRYRGDPGSAANKRPHLEKKRQLANVVPAVLVGGKLQGSRSLERLVEEVVLSGGATDVGADTPLRRAQDLICEALDSSDPELQVQLALRALLVSPDCADALVLLGDHADSDDEAMLLYERGVAAGARVLGDDTFQKHAGDFWTRLETRPYMRAKERLARHIWASGRVADAIEHYQQMLELNPCDNQEVRYACLCCLIELGCDDEARQLIELFPDDGSAEWHYGRVLLAFRAENDSPAACQFLIEAARQNTHVPDYLVGFETISTTAPPYITMGEKSEAGMYALGWLKVWADTPGAIPWVRRTLGLPTTRSRRAPRVNWKKIGRELLQLDQDSDDVWHVDLRKMLRIDQSNEAEMWAVIITCPTRDALLSIETRDVRPTNLQLLELVARCMQKPEDATPRRPGTILVRLKSLCSAWQEKMAGVGIACRQAAELTDVDRIVEALISQVEHHAQQLPALSQKELTRLPMATDQVWQLDVRRVAIWYGDEGPPQRPWTGIVTSATEELIVAQEMEVTEPGGDWAIELLRQAMSSPACGNPRRPAQVLVHRRHLYSRLAPWLQQLDIDCVEVEELTHLEEVLEELVARVAEDIGRAPLLSAPGVRQSDVASLFHAAADFYRRQPWRFAPADVPILVQCQQFGSGPWYAIVMGQSGMVEGFALYEDREALSRLLAGQLSDGEMARLTSSLALYFNEAFEIPPLDLHHAERFGWPVASREAYPTIMRINPGMTLRPPLEWELRLMSTCLQFIPVFLEAGQSSPTHAIEAISNELTLRLSWADGF